MKSPTKTKRGNEPQRMSALICAAAHSNRLSSIGREVRRIERINELLEPQLPPDVRGHCRVACAQGDDMLILSAPSAAWNTRLRFHLAEIQRRMREHPELARFREVRVRTIIPENTEDASKPQPPMVDAAVPQILNSAAAATRNPALRASLERLAACMEKQRNSQ